MNIEAGTAHSSHFSVNWSNSANCGSRSANANNAALNLNANNAGRGVTDTQALAELTLRLAVPAWPNGRIQNGGVAGLVVIAKVRQHIIKIMKRYGNLKEKIITKENIELAYSRAKKGKTWQNTVQEVEIRKELALEEVRCMMADQTFSTAEYRCKKVYEPKEREIFILPFFPDRIVQHALMAVIAPIWDRMFDPVSHACRPGKGQHSASRLVMENVRRGGYCLQGDVKKFYPSISHDVAMNIVERKIKDQWVLWIMEDIIRSFPGDRNIPIGNLTSQWIGNLVLNELDTYVRHTLKPEGYVRYNDDFLLFSHSKKALREFQDQIREFLKSSLKLTLSKDRVYPVSQGVDFVGYRHFAKYVLVRKSTARRVKKRISHLRWEINKGLVDAKRARSVVSSTEGWLRWANAYNLRQAMHIDEIKEEIDGLCA
ncbi:MAG: reverse transcriptase/maturase family protein [Spirochaetaceae bacterium]|nr:reverse transcriptase/maturase family protein [Spirochaetaceae bacterium]MCF7947201.1 reverse transcriptase/maturase family protein [Spirochaetia bacterium]MCF7950066.1 reverse transcriptase/maturase family protein [Spirochaetaceae bacterium]